MLTSAEADAMAASLNVDSHGWPASLPNGTKLVLQMGYSTDDAFDPETNQTGGAFLHGVYVLTWVGNGSVFVLTSRNNGIGARTLLNVPGRIVVCIDTPSRFARCCCLCMSTTAVLQF